MFVRKTISLMFPYATVQVHFSLEGLESHRPRIVHAAIKCRIGQAQS